MTTRSLSSRIVPVRRDHARRFFLSALGGAAILRPSPAATPFATRGVVLLPEDLTLRNWPDRAKQAQLTTVALHHGRSVFEVIKFITSDPG
ncbi:MAG: hypothetical protein ABFD86_17450, partial [Bryobacteraceae bacterium]